MLLDILALTIIKTQNIILKRLGDLLLVDKNNVYITYPNGISIPNQGWFSPKITEGSVIHVNSRKISSQSENTFWQSFATISGQAANLATTLLSLTLIANQGNSGN